MTDSEVWLVGAKDYGNLDNSSQLLCNKDLRMNVSPLKEDGLK